MAEERIQRRLAAILAADVVGYSRLMREVETGTADMFANSIDLCEGSISKIRECRMKMPSLKTIFVLVAISAVAACSPEFGSKEWCEDMKEKDKGQWTAQEGTEFTAYCRR